MLTEDYLKGRTLRAAARRWLRGLGAGRRRRSLRASRSGLLVVDMQRFFVEPGAPAFLPAAPAVLPEVLRLVSAFRAAGRPVAYAVYATKSGTPMARRWKRRCPAGSAWTAMAAGLAPLPAEPVFVKPGYSALRGTRARTWLRRRGAADLVVAGVMTDLCVESTVRDAFEDGFSVFVPLDACAAAREVSHLGALGSMGTGFASVVPSAELVRILRRK